MKRSERLGQAQLRASERALGRIELDRRQADERVMEMLGLAPEKYIPRPRRETPAEARDRLRKAAPAFVAVSHRAAPSAERPRRDGSVPIEIEAAIAKVPRTSGQRFRSQSGAQYVVGKDGAVRRTDKARGGKAAKRARRRMRTAPPEAAHGAAGPGWLPGDPLEVTGGTAGPRRGRVTEVSPEGRLLKARMDDGTDMTFPAGVGGP